MQGKTGASATRALLPHLNGIIVFFYVDDIVFAYQRKNETRAQALEAQMREKYQLTGGNSLQWFLGIEILRDREKGFIWLSQASYIDKISRLAKKHRSFDTPMGVNELFPFNGIASFADINSYQVKIGSVLYAAVITRPDIAFVTSKLSKFNSNPGPKHHEAADRVICYLQQTKGLALRLGGGDDFEVASDASFADNSSDRKSSQAFAMKLFGGLIAAKESIYVATLRTKLRHVDIHNHWLRQEITNGTLEVKYTPSAEMMADGLTKALQGPKFQAFVNQIGLHDISDRLASRELPESTDSILQEQSYKMWEDQVV
ncbi:reverse transcriptase (RNA-dependent DNA polymerase) [Hirsutella rhossiliensis]|uniref:Reverse transcriptase (RNA-dependent DNA polymerase) domain-containing protein n=1 Tax=Hirsutella rhossiliensis TaxID=111463 RepID=A0A9P8SM98_9HYPO|nr:reverse transcriptase (RNA-dependent DNA polymerase) domain-containing protein [Hirsutella rhossiliensis]KAH0968343.1 reverse transcriptase (RNA-dependent DNA polymerase) domain-containing protein [Hirsutella rhossiliensis]